MIAQSFLSAFYAGGLLEKTEFVPSITSHVTINMSVPTETFLQIATSLAAASAEATALKAELAARNAEVAALKAMVAALKASSETPTGSQQSLGDQARTFLMSLVAEVNRTVPGSMQYRAPRTDSPWDLIFAAKGAVDHAQKVLSSSHSGSSAPPTRGRSDRGTETARGSEATRGSRGAARGRYLDRIPAALSTSTQNLSSANDQHCQAGIRVYLARAPPTQSSTCTPIQSQTADQGPDQSQTQVYDAQFYQQLVDQLETAEADIATAAEIGDMAAFDRAVTAFRLVCSEIAETPDHPRWPASWFHDGIARIESRIPDWAKQCGFTV